MAALSNNIRRSCKCIENNLPLFSKLFSLLLGHYKVPYLVQIFLLNAGVYSKDLQFNNLGTNDNFLKHNICRHKFRWKNIVQNYGWSIPFNCFRRLLCITGGTLNQFRWTGNPWNIPDVQNGDRATVVQAVMHVPCAAFQARMAAGVPAPAVATSATPPAPAQQATQTVLQPVWQTPYPIIPNSPASADPSRRRVARRVTAVWNFEKEDHFKLVQWLWLSWQSGCFGSRKSVVRIQSLAIFYIYC